MSGENKSQTKPKTNYLLICETLPYLGWSEEEFVETCRDFHFSSIQYDWEEVLKRLWGATYLRMERKMEMVYNFRQYHYWREIIPFAFTINRNKLIGNGHTEDFILEELEEAIARQSVLLLPTEQLHRQLVWAPAHLIVHLYNFMHKNHEATFVQITEMRNAVQKRIEIAEMKRQARYLRSQIKLNKRHYRH